MASFVSALIFTVETLYGCIILTAALAYSCFQWEFWFTRTAEEELALREG